MAKKSKTSGVVVYNLLLKEVTAINNNLPEDRKMSLKQRREFVSKKVYPKFKGVNKRDIRLRSLRESLYRKIKRIPKKKGCDVLALDDTIYTDVDYYAIDEFISRVMPDCIYIKVTAGEFGETRIFNTRDYDYYNSGVATITNNINKYLAERVSGDAVYKGFIELRPGKKNNGVPDSYFLNMILYINNWATEVSNPVKVPKVKKTARQKKMQKDFRKHVEEKIKHLKKEKGLIKRIKKGVSKEIKEYLQFRKSKKLSKDAKEDLRKRFHDSELKKIKRYFEKGVITDKDYKILGKRIQEGYRKK